MAKPDTEKGELKYLLPQILPGGRVILFTVTHTPLPTWEDTEIVAQSLATGERTVLIRGGADGRYLPSGHLLYVRRGTLMAVPFNLERLEVTGGAVALIADVMQSANTPRRWPRAAPGSSASPNRDPCSIVPGGIFPDPERSLVWVDRPPARCNRCRCPPARISRRASHPTAIGSSSGRKATGTSGCTTSHEAR